MLILPRRYLGTGPHILPDKKKANAEATLCHQDKI